MQKLFIKVILGFAAVAPLLSIASVAAVVVFQMHSTSRPIGTYLLVFGGSSLLLFAAATAYFLYLANTHADLSPSEKSTWTMLLLLWFPFGALGFWYRFIWREKT
jgi:hypothetical protein